MTKGTFKSDDVGVFAFSVLIGLIDFDHVLVHPRARSLIGVLIVDIWCPLA